MKINSLFMNAGAIVVAACVLVLCAGSFAQTAADNVHPGTPSVSRPVLDRWSQAIEGALAGIDADAPAPAPAVGNGVTLKSGASGGRVDRLANQLIARGMLAADGYHGLFDAGLEAAVRAFQLASGINADGVAGEGTVESLDRSPAAAVAALKSTLGAVRALAVNAPREFFMINIPSQTAYLIKGDTVVMTMRVAVGRPSRPTPILNDQITDVILNPTWTAPTTVLAQDKLPSLRRTGHPGIEGATVYLDQQEVDPAVVDWSAVTPERVRIVQSPGDQNALGRYKFNMTNGQSIYMHDTNDHSVFARQGRALSSGCVRLAEPRRLAEMLLGRDGWTPERIGVAVANERTQHIGLSHSLPVRIVYWQASVDDAGVVRIHKDIYGRNGQSSPVASVPPSEPAKPGHHLERVAVGGARGIPISVNCNESCGQGLY
ncbi:MAG: L,D-transpeptidase family protein [Rhodospirillaceae bacterium]